MMIDKSDVELVVELRRLLMLAETDENEALTRLHALIDTHGRATVGAALAVAAPAELANLAAADAPHVPEQPSTGVYSATGPVAHASDPYQRQTQ